MIIEESKLKTAIYVEKLNEVFFRIHCSHTFATGFRSVMRERTKNYFFDPRFKMKLWDGYLTFFNIDTRLLPIGLVNDLLDYCSKHNFQVNYLFDKESMFNNVTIEEIVEYSKKILNGTKYELRDYQLDSVYRCIKVQRGIVEAATNSGKSLIIYMIFRYMLDNCSNKLLLIVPSIGLLTQMFNDFKDYGWADVDDYITLLGGKHKYDDNKRILVSTWQSLQTKDVKFLGQFEGVLVDEVHQGMNSNSKSIKSILTSCINARFRIGTTGTLPTNKADLKTVYGYLGVTLSKVTNQELIEKGLSSDIDITNILLRYTQEENIKVAHMNYDGEVGYVNKHTERNKIFKFVIDKGTNPTENILILVQFHKHLDLIYKYLKALYPDREIRKYSGKVKADNREDIRQSMEGLEGAIIIGTYSSISTGINIPKLHNIFFGSSYKTHFKVLQAIGRGLRKHSTKTKLKLWVLVDDFRYKKASGTTKVNYLYKHHLERCDIYKKQGFTFKDKPIDIYQL